MDITVILPIHNERQNLTPLLDEIERALTPTGYSFEVLAVDDGSSDGSGELLRTLAFDRAYLKVLSFRQNYGQSAAFDAGFRSASGRIVVTMDADLQNDPADLPRMIQLVDEQGYDFVIGQRVDRQDKWLRTIFSKTAGKIIRFVTRTRFHDLGCSLKVYRREITDELKLYGEMHRFIGVLVEGLGAKTIEVPVHHRPRAHGRSNYGFTRTFKVLLDLITVWFMRGYQTKPIYIFGGAGLFLGFSGVLISVFVLWQKFYLGIWVHNNPLFIIAMIFSVMAVQFLALGLLAEIVIRTYFESQHKSTYLIGEKFGFEPSQRSQSSVAVAISPKVLETPPRQPADAHLAES
jgi:glycosyltransferase involved in cell wall biosynthesis